MAVWYIKTESGSITGPYTEVQVKNGLETNAISDGMFVRQQESEWIPASRVRMLFQKLVCDGFFIRDRAGKIFGPFTKQRVLEMNRATQLPSHYWIKQGKQPSWTEIRTTLTTPPVAAKPQTARQAVSAPARPVLPTPTNHIPQANPVIPPAPVMKLRGNSLRDRLVTFTERVEDVLLGNPMPNG